MPNPLPPSDPRRGRRKQYRARPRPSDVRRAMRRRALRLNAPEETPAPTTEVDLRIDAQVARDHKRVREQRGVTNERLNEPRAMYESIRKPGAAHGSVSAKVAKDLIDRCRTAAERRAAMILGAELWRKQVSRVVISIADKVEGMANLAAAEIAELGNALEATRRRLELLELSNAALAAKVKNLAKRGPRSKAAQRRRREGGAR